MRERGMHRTGPGLVGLTASLLLAGALLVGEARAADAGPAPGRASAAPTPTTVNREAQRRFAIGARAFDASRFDDAYEQFEQAYMLWPRTTFLLAMAHAQMRLGNPAKARALYELCLNSDGREVRRRLAELDGPTPVAARPESVPMPTMDVPTAASGPDTTALTLQPVPALADHPTPWHRRWWVWTAGAVTLAGVGAIIAVSLSRPGYTDRGTLGYLGVPDR